MKYEPEWKQYEKDLHSEDSNKARKAAVAFDETRKQELRNSAKARRWEESRQESWRKDKPQWKKQELKREREELEKINKELREGGYLMNGLKPRPGLIVVKEEKQQEDNNGIFIPDNVEWQSNTCRVVRTSPPLITTQGPMECPCKEGDLVLVRNGSGLAIKINKEQHLLIRFDEVFGVVEE